MKSFSSYDEVPYPSYTFPQTSPDRLATMAVLNGIRAAPPDRCRVLELGCGDGANLLSFAYALPESEFLGVDLSSVHISDATAAVVELELRNARFLQMDLADLDVEEFGQFDYVIAHGLYSWVPPAIRERILDIYSQILNPEGVGYISYNAFPGCHFRKMISELMCFHTADERDPYKKIEAGHEILEFLARSMPNDGLYKEIIADERARLLEKSPENVLHDDLSEFNQPFYLHEFIHSLVPYRLQYVSDANPICLGDGPVSREASAVLDAISGDDHIRREQYLDFLELARFRSSIVCRQELKVDRSAGLSAIRTLRIASQIRPVSAIPSTNTNAAESFIGHKAGRFELNHPLTKTALVILRKEWPHSIAFTDLIDGCREVLGEGAFDDNGIMRTRGFIFELFKAGFIKLHVHENTFTRSVGDFPEASRFARWQIERGCGSISSLAGVNISPEFDAVRALILLLDGTRDRSMLAKDMIKTVTAPFSEREDFEKKLPEMIDANLTKMAEWGLLLR
ncbi:MAG: methyltransferase regulatory domain-containing protein [Pyrinomonadaceae bacterium]